MYKLLFLSLLVCTALGHKEQEKTKTIIVHEIEQQQNNHNTLTERVINIQNNSSDDEWQPNLSDCKKSVINILHLTSGCTLATLGIVGQELTKNSNEPILNILYHVIAFIGSAQIGWGLFSTKQTCSDIGSDISSSDSDTTSESDSDTE